MPGKSVSGKGFVVTIDGPAASGKSTTARKVAEELGWLYLDTGAMYRAMAVKALDSGILPADAAAIGKLAEQTLVRLENTGGGMHVLVDGRDVSDRIRTPEVDRAVGPVCEVSRVREVMVALQRAAAAQGNLIAEGRDMGTVVFPAADLKFYMMASLEARAGRRRLDMEKQGLKMTVEELAEEIRIRDERDSGRTNSPLVPAPDAIAVDTTRMTVEEQTRFILGRIREKMKGQHRHANHD
ncbi:(d)CMP kinase [bacterium]|nr:(d)CMP kinase [bacterium]